MKIKTYKFVRQEGVEVDIPIPDKTIYLFEYGVRRSICITPKWTTWNVENLQKPEEIYRLDVVCVYRSFSNKIEYFSIGISSIESIVNSQNNNSTEKQIIQLIQNQEDRNERTREQFMNDYNSCIEKINEVLEESVNSIV